MADMDDNMLARGLMAMYNAGQSASKPLKTSEITYTTPTELADMRQRRDTIGQTRQALADSLRKQETRGYTFGNALANLGGQTIPGQIDWLGGLRAAGGAYTNPINAEINRLKTDYELADKDLERALEYDKAMGATQRSVYDYAGGGAGGVGGFGDKIVRKMAAPTDEGIDPEEFVDMYNTGGFLAGMALNKDPQDNPTLWARTTRQFLAPESASAMAALSQDLTNNVIGPKIENMVQNMGGARGGDTIREVTARIGEIVNTPYLSTDQQKAALLATKMDVLKTLNADRAAGGLPPLTVEQFQPYWNGLFSGARAYHIKYGKGKDQVSKSAASTKVSPDAPYDYSKYGF